MDPRSDVSATSTIHDKEVLGQRLWCILQCRGAIPSQDKRSHVVTSWRNVCWTTYREMSSVRRRQAKRSSSLLLWTWCQEMLSGALTRLLAWGEDWQPRMEGNANWKQPEHVGTLLRHWMNPLSSLRLSGGITSSWLPPVCGLSKCNPRITHLQQQSSPLTVLHDIPQWFCANWRFPFTSTRGKSWADGFLVSFPSTFYQNTLFLSYYLW